MRVDGTYALDSSWKAYRDHHPLATMYKLYLMSSMFLFVIEADIAGQQNAGSR